MMRNKENLIKKVNISKQKVLQNLPKSVSKIFNLSSVTKFCILKNNHLTKNVFWIDHCSCFFKLISFYTNSEFNVIMVQLQTLILLIFLCFYFLYFNPLLSCLGLFENAFIYTSWLVKLFFQRIHSYRNGLAF